MENSNSVSCEVKNNIPIMKILGEMTSETDPNIVKAYHDLCDEKSYTNLIVDFEQTQYINSAGIATLINIIQEFTNNNGQVFFIGLTEHLRKVMDIVGISDFIEIYNEKDEVLALLT